MIKTPFGTPEGPASGAASGHASPASGINDALEAFRQAWSSFALPPGMTPTIDPTEVERRIAELRTVEQWLVLNLGMLRNSIQALELQLTTLAAMRSFGIGAGSRPAEVKAGSQAHPDAAADAASMATGWLDMLHRQFNEIATAAMSGVARADEATGAAGSSSKANQASGGGSKRRTAPGGQATGRGNAAGKPAGGRGKRSSGNSRP